MRRILVSLAIILFLAYFVVCLNSDPSPQWNPSADVRIVYTTPGLQEIDFNYLPDVQLWGNGTYIWVERHSNEGRQVFHDQLSEQQIRDLIQTSIDAGMFRFFQRLKNIDQPCVYYGIDEELHIELLDARTYLLIRRSNEQLCRLTRHITDGLELEGIPFKPKSGMLYPVPLEITSFDTDLPAIQDWSMTTLDINLQEVYQSSGGIEISGEALEFAWKIVNENSKPIVTFQEDKYWLGLVIPELYPN